ncbi:hypothetical protein HOY80DRAFT_1134906 [Tuber brumale]|nr:hypothetical protein HOY80DRAFT_1134906 [Tuber brumale]
MEPRSRRSRTRAMDPGGDGDLTRRHRYDNRTPQSTRRPNGSIPGSHANPIANASLASEVPLEGHHGAYNARGMAAQDVLGILKRAMRDRNIHINVGAPMGISKGTEAWGDVLDTRGVYVPVFGWMAVRGAENVGNYIWEGGG